jgi:hypothetical protein
MNGSIKTLEEKKTLDAGGIPLTLAIPVGFYISHSSK